MGRQFWTITALAATLMASQQVQAAGFSTALGQLRMLTLTSTGSIPEAEAPAPICIAAKDGAVQRADMALWVMSTQPSWEI